MKNFYRSLENRAEKAVVADPQKVRYAGFNTRMITNMIDMLVLFLLSLPLLFIIDIPDLSQMPAKAPPQIIEAYQMHSEGKMTDEEFNHAVLPVVLVNIIKYTVMNIIVIGIIYVIFWHYFNSSPGKMLLGIRIVDEKTFQNPSTGQYIMRFIGYLVSALTLCIGFIMIGLNKRKRGLHDIMAGTVVIYAQPLDPAWEKKKLKYQSYFMILLLVIGAIYISKILGK